MTDGRWMPILGEHDVVEPLGETIDHWNHFVPRGTDRLPPAQKSF